MPTLTEAITAVVERARSRCRACQIEVQVEGIEVVFSGHTCHGDLELVEAAMLAAVEIAFPGGCESAACSTQPHGSEDWVCDACRLKAEIKRQFALQKGDEGG